MKLIYQTTAALLFPFLLPAQSMRVGSGTSVVIQDDAKLVLNNASLVNDGSIYAGKSTFIFTGNNHSSIGGNAPVMFNHLIVKQPGNQLKLENDISISGLLDMQGGNLELNNHRIDLGRSGSINGENSQSRITGENGGTISAIALLNAPQNVNPGNMGIVITSAANMGTTIITRGHVQQTNERGERSINRYYDIQPSAKADMSVHILYLKPELASNPESSLVLWSTMTRRFTLGIGDKKVAPKAFLVSSYPNPTPDRFTVALYSETEKRGAVSLTDAFGRVLERKPVQYIKGTNTLQWDLAKYATGTYFLVFENTGQANLKVVKQ